MPATSRLMRTLALDQHLHHYGWCGRKVSGDKYFFGAMQRINSTICEYILRLLCAPGNDLLLQLAVILPPILLNLIRQIAGVGATFKSLKDAWADITTAHGRLLLTVLGGPAEFERELIVVRAGEGRERAKAKSVVFGRKPKLTRHQRQEALARREARQTLVEIARSYNVHHSTIGRSDRTRLD